MAKKGKAEKQGGKIDSQFVRLESLSDLARNTTSFSDSTRPIFAQKIGSAYRLFEQGPKVGAVRFIFYSESKTCGKFLAYKPASGAGPEILEMKETIPFEMQRGEVRNIPIVEITTSPFNEKKRATKVISVEVKDYASMVKGAITRSLDSESIGKVYAFRSGNQGYIGSLSLIEEEDKKVFCYSKIDYDAPFAFLRYNYQADKVEPTDIFGDHPYLYVRVINLAQPFTFFKPD